MMVSRQTQFTKQKTGIYSDTEEPFKCIWCAVTVRQSKEQLELSVRTEPQTVE